MHRHPGGAFGKCTVIPEERSEIRDLLGVG